MSALTGLGTRAFWERRAQNTTGVHRCNQFTTAVYSAVYMRPHVSTSPDAPQVERAYREIKAGIVEGRYRPGAPHVGGHAGAGARHEPYAGARRARPAVAGTIPRPRGRPRLLRRPRDRAIDPRNLRRATRLEGAAAAWAAERATDDEIAGAPASGLAAADAPPNSVAAAARRPAEYRDAEAANVVSISRSPKPRAIPWRWN